MDIVFILVFSLVGLAVAWLRSRRIMPFILLALSVLSIFWLQPLTPIRSLEFWLPTASIAMTAFVWAATYPGNKRTFTAMLPGLGVLLLMILVIAATRYLDFLCCLTPARPPEILAVLAASIAILLICFAVYFLLPAKTLPAAVVIVILFGLFIVMKYEALSRFASAWLRDISGQSADLASSTDLAWLGFSFLAFRLLHAARDRQANRLPALSLVEFGTYALFFPAVVSGPIDRAQHFVAELSKAAQAQSEPGWKQTALRNSVLGIQRILIGTLKKIVLADGLAYFALNQQNAGQVGSTGWAWLLLLAFSLRIYLDFSGYTDIAIGTAQLMGITLPENFNTPYSKRNLTDFWNSWHITLAQWFRSYLFFPFTRFLRSQSQSFPVWGVILAGQLLTMVSIGLWHGITWNFFIWGAWHGMGLFVQNRWSGGLGPRMNPSNRSSAFSFVLQGSSWLATFVYVSLGWVWFALPSPAMALAFFSRLAGFNP